MRRKRERVSHCGGGVLKTKQSEAEACDVNLIVSKWRRTGAPPPMKTPGYGDMTGSTDYHEMMNRVKQADSDFEELPSAVRRHCGQDPGKFLDMVSDPERRGELEELGLIPERAPEGSPDAIPVTKSEESEEVIPPPN